MISTFMSLMPTALEQGLLLSLVALGLMIPFRLLNLADLTSEGAYPLGGILCGTLLTVGVNPYMATLAGCLAAGLIGICTGSLYLRFKMNPLLAGIIFATMVYSVNLRIMGQPNIALLHEVTILSPFAESLPLKIGIFLAINLVVVGVLFLFLQTETGLRMRAVGLNPFFAERQGVALPHYTILGFFLGSALPGLAGTLIVQCQGYADMGMGVGILIHGLASLMIGESIVGSKTLLRQLLAPLVGAIIYQQFQGLSLSFGLAPTDLKFVTGALVLVTLVIQKWQKSSLTKQVHGNQ